MTLPRHLLYTFCALTIGCGQPASPPSSTSPEPATIPTRQAPPVAGATPQPVRWPPGPLKLDATDVLKFSQWQGGVAGTDGTDLEIRGDGAVKFAGGRSGGPGGKEVSKTGKLSPEQTKQFFEGLRTSGYLDSTDAQVGQQGFEVTGEVDGVKLNVEVLPHGPRFEAIQKQLEPVRGALK